MAAKGEQVRHATRTSRKPGSEGNPDQTTVAEMKQRVARIDRTMSELRRERLELCWAIYQCLVESRKGQT